MLRGVPGGPHQKLIMSKIASQNSVSDKSALAINNNFLIQNWGFKVLHKQAATKRIKKSEGSEPNIH
ncbi:MAG TPA: hypothetical protein DIC42_04860 [Holosporales bacterium]|nr:hypothetical protein [Holosporales bacterium]